MQKRVTASGNLQTLFSLVQKGQRLRELTNRRYGYVRVVPGVSVYLRTPYGDSRETSAAVSRRRMASTGKWGLLAAAPLGDTREMSTENLDAIWRLAAPMS